MASSVSGQDEPNRVLWLATQADKIEPSCLLRTTCRVPWEKFPRKPYDKPFSVKNFWILALFFFFASL